MLDFKSLRSWFSPQQLKEEEQILEAESVKVSENANGQVNTTQVVPATEVEAENAALKTELKRLNIELRGQLTALHNAAIVSETDIRGNITFVNDLFVQYAKYTREELMGKNHRIIKSDQYNQEQWKQVWDTIASGDYWQGEVKNIAKDGSVYWVHATITPVLNDKGYVVKYVSVRFPINKMIAQREQLQHMAAELEEKQESLNNAYHDLEKAKELVVHELKESVNYAERIQRSIIPSPVELQQMIPQTFEIATYFSPKDQLSGDFYWAGKWRDRVLLAVGDGMGHGVPGAMLALSGITSLMKLVEERGLTEPGSLLDELNHEITRLLNQHQEKREDVINDSIELAAVQFTEGSKSVQVSSAMLGVVLVRNEQADYVEAIARRPIGGTLHKDQHFDVKRLELQPGDTLFLFSDGFKTQMHPETYKPMGKARFNELLVEASKVPLSQHPSFFSEEMLKYKGYYQGQSDDITVISLRLRS